MSYTEKIHDHFIDLMYEDWLESYYRPSKPVKQKQSFEREKKESIRKTINERGFDVYINGRTDLKCKLRDRILEDLGI